MANWTDAIVGERMAVDQEFNDRIAASEFSSQEWGLIMTAIEFEIEAPADTEQARIVADTTKLPQIMPELENIQSQMGAMGQDSGRSSSSGGGLVESLKGVIGLGDSSGGNDRLEAAEQLTQAYADELQSHLESNGKWKQVRVAYQE